LVTGTVERIAGLFTVMAANLISKITNGPKRHSIPAVKLEFAIWAGGRVDVASSTLH